MAQVNILIAVNGAAIAEDVKNKVIKAGTITKPTGLGGANPAHSSNVYLNMVAPNNYLTNMLSEGQSELSITCNKGDTLQWSIISFDMNAEQTPYLYDSMFKHPKTDTQESTPVGITKLQYVTTPIVNYFPPNGAPTSTPIKANNTITNATGNITIANQKINYRLSFVLIDNLNGKPIGYFTWDPFIIVNK